MSVSSDRAVAGDQRDTVTISVSGVAMVSIGAVVFLNLANAVAVALRPWEGKRFSGTADWLLLTSENNVATWLSSGLWLAAAATALAMSMVVGRDVRRRWIELSVVLLLLSIDEAASVHEKLTDWLSIEDGDVVAYAWVIPASVIVFVIALRLAPFVLKLEAATRATVIGGFALLLLGAIVVETLAGEWDEANGADNVGYHLISAVEENLEYAGGIVMFVGLLAAIRRQSERVDVTLE